MAASAASALAIMAGTTIKAFKNSKMMFHGAQTYTEGGKGTHEDNADLLGKINADIMNVLVSRFNMNPDTVAGWFAEGRQGWLNATEMIESGIASGIEDADDNVIEFEDAALSEMNGQGLNIAALLEKETMQDETEDGDGTTPAQETETAETSGVETGASANQDADAAADAADIVAAQIAVAVSEKTLDLTNQIEELRAKYTALDAEKRGVQSKLDKVTAEFETAKKTHTAAILNMQDALEKANARIVRFLGAANSFSPEPKDWAEALKLCNGSHEQAKARFDHLRQAYNQEQKQKREAKR
jgi:chromosome segregation ATPase